MSRLTVTLHNCSRPKDEKVLLETTFRDELLWVCPNPDVLLKLRQAWLQADPAQRVGYDYPRIYSNAFRNTIGNRNEKEYNKWRFVINWTP